MAGKILVPVDFSNHTMVSCHYALFLAKMTSNDIMLFHSFFDQIYFSDGGFATGFESGIMLTDELILDFYRQKEAKLNEIAEELRAKLETQGMTGISVTCQMESGDPEVQILNTINRNNPVMIVMGSSGMGKKSLLSGSVARRIMDHTSIPVFAIPEAEHHPEITQVAYMTIFDPADPEVISHIHSLLDPMHFRIHCLHICQPGKVAESISYKEQLAASVSGIQGIGLELHVQSGTDPKGILEDFIKAHGINLLAFIPHKRNIFKSFSRQNLSREDLFQTDIPILAIPAKS